MPLGVQIWLYVTELDFLKKIPIDISVFFNRQYFTNISISDFDFWHVDRHE